MTESYVKFLVANAIFQLINCFLPFLFKIIKNKVIENISTKFADNSNKNNADNDSKCKL